MVQGEAVGLVNVVVGEAGENGRTCDLVALCVDAPQVRSLDAQGAAQERRGTGCCAGGSVLVLRFVLMPRIGWQLMHSHPLGIFSLLWK